MNFDSYVLAQNKIIYVPIAKNACSYFKTIILQIAGLPLPEPFQGGKETKTKMSIHDRDHINIPSIQDFEDVDNLLSNSSYFKFIIKRNPYDRLYSAWANKILFEEPHFAPFIKEIKSTLSINNEERISFSQFVEYLDKHIDVENCDQHWRLQSKVICNKELETFHIYDIKDTNEVIKGIKHRTKLDFFSYDKINRSFDFRILYPITKESADIIYKLYQKDFINLGYDIESWKYSDKSKIENIDLEFFISEIIQRNISIGILFDMKDKIK